MNYKVGITIIASILASYAPFELIRVIYKYMIVERGGYLPLHVYWAEILLISLGYIGFIFVVYSSLCLAEKIGARNEYSKRYRK